MEDKLILEHKKEKEESIDFKKRRFSQWKENYLLYRDKVQTNAFTQRQATNLPVMRETIQTWISKIDEAPELKFKSRGRSGKHKNGEIILDELWSYYFDKLKLDVLDNMDKKNVGLQGRSFKIAGINKGEFFVDIIDAYDIEISPKANPLDLNTAQYVIRTHIFKPLREILANPKYDESAKSKLKIYLQSKEGIIKTKDTQEAYLESIQRLKDLGAQNYDDFNATEVLVELNESYKLVWNKEENKFVRHFIVIGADQVVLYNKPLKQAKGITRLPIVTWADDPDHNDVWCDGKGDSVRTINKVINMYMSQDLENRVLRNYGMYFFNTMNGTFVPKAYDPKPWGMFGVPGKPEEIMKQVEIPALNDTTNQIQFLKDLIQSSVAQTPTERGEQTKSRTTLGEIQLNLEQSQGRNYVTTKQYRRAWKEIGELFYELMSNNTSGMITLYKKGPNGDLYSKDIYPSEWIKPEGYECQVIFKSESNMLDQMILQKSQYVINNFQNNPVAVKIAKRKQLELMGWTSEEIEQAMAAEENMNMASSLAGQTGQSNSSTAPSTPLTNSQILQQQ